jgi:uncharacterized membrane protein YfcA
VSEHEPTSTVGAVAGAAKSVLGSLPGQFLALLLMNTVFILGLLMFLDRQTTAREHMMGKYIDACTAMQEQHMGRDK